MILSIYSGADGTCVDDSYFDNHDYDDDTDDDTDNDTGDDLDDGHTAKKRGA